VDTEKSFLKDLPPDRLCQSKLHVKILICRQVDEKKDDGKSDENNPPAALRLPKGKLWFGFDVKPLKTGSTKEKEETPEQFRGQGNSLRK
jgi:hypothetical protein